jgi:hypothetical protein
MKAQTQEEILKVYYSTVGSSKKKISKPRSKFLLMGAG